MPLAFQDTVGSDSPIAFAGDTNFVGLNNRVQPENLSEGYVAVSQNMRFNQFRAEIRKGLEKQTNDISFDNTPLVLPFTIGPSSVILPSFTDAIFGSVVFSDPNNNNLEWIVVATGTKSYMFSPGEVVTSQDYPAGETVESTDTVDLFQTAGSVYMLRGQYAVTLGITSITEAAGTATVTTDDNHGLTTGQWVKISGADQAEYNILAQITVTGLDEFTYAVTGSPASPATGTIVYNQYKIPLRWDGDQTVDWVLVNYGTISTPLIYMPTSNFGLLQADRAILQYDRNELIVSYIQNVEQYDTLAGIFTVAQGWSDYLVGFHPYQDTQMLIFNRHSIYLLEGITGDVSGMRTREITRQVGCVSRRTIATCGPNVLFLSDNGVFVLQPGYELLLRGISEPLSADIDTTIRRINFNLVGVACAVYNNNRYYLAVPLDGSTRNNAILVYNFINKSWESVDTFPNGFYCDFLNVMNMDNVQTVFAISSDGGIYAYEQLEEDEYAVADQEPATFTIEGVLRTRRHIFNTPVLKRFNSVSTNFNLNANSGFELDAIVANPDQTKSLTGVSTTTANDITRPGIVGMRGYGIQFEYRNTANRGSITNYTVSAYVQDQKLTKSP